MKVYKFLTTSFSSSSYIMSKMKKDSYIGERIENAISKMEPKWEKEEKNYQNWK